MKPRSFRGCLWTLLVSVALCFAHSASAVTPALKLGEINVQRGKSPDDLNDFAHLVRREFDRLTVPSRAPKEAYILSATLTELSTIEAEHSHTTTCVVTATLRDRKGGALYATLRGSVRVEASLEEGDHPERSVELLAMQRAVVRALGRVRDALPR